MLQSSPIPSLPPPSQNGLVQSPSRLSPIDWENAIKPPPPISSRSNRTHQHSRSTAELPPLVNPSQVGKPSRNSLFLPFKDTNKSSSPTRSRAQSPSRDSETFDNISTKEDADRKAASHSKTAKVASWFSGDSEPVNLGLVPSPNKEKSDPFSIGEEQEESKDDLESLKPYNSTLTGDARPALQSSSSLTKLQKRLSTSPTRAAQPSMTPSSAPAPLSSRFSFFKSKSPTTATPTCPNQPQSPDPLLTLSIPSALFPHGEPPNATFSPAAYKNLQQNAQGTLNRFQDSLRNTTSTLQSLQSTHAVLTDDLSASETRASALKSQLTEMADSVSKLEGEKQRLLEELACERQCRQEEEDLRRGTIKLVHPPRRGRQGRVSDISASSISSADSIDARSEVDSVFSMPEHQYQHHQQDLGQRSISPITVDSSGGFSPVKAPGTQGGTMPWTQAKSGGEAWDLVEMMRAENRALKARIEELEGANEGALEVLSGLGLH
ncbi:MAG: hypothetical protein Q9160_008367 [Pyrenula sp. 1 TL-2023]